MMLGNATVGREEVRDVLAPHHGPQPEALGAGQPEPLHDAHQRPRRAARTRCASAGCVKTGIRSIKLQPDGTMLLNGKTLNYRGMGIHEDDPNLGFAIDNAQRQAIIAETKEIGATLLRSHYPLHP